MSEILSILAIVISLLNFIWTIFIYLRSKYAGVELSLKSRERLKYEEGKQKLSIGAWNMYSREISPSDKSPFPRYLIVEDLDNKFYLLNFLTKSGGLIFPQKTVKFKDKRKMEIYMGWIK